MNLNSPAHLWCPCNVTFECFDIGLLVTLWAIDRLGRRKTMALCFFIFSMCIIPLYGCVGRWEWLQLVRFQTGEPPSITSWFVLQGLHDRVDIHRQSFHRRRISGRLRLHSRGEGPSWIAGDSSNQGAHHCCGNLCRCIQRQPGLWVWEQAAEWRE